MNTLEQARDLVKSHISKDLPQLEFRRLSEHAIICKCCSQFYVGKVTVQGIELYECWFKTPGNSAAVCLRQNLPTGTEAKIWISAIASAYKRGNLSLKAPPTRDEIERLRATA